MIAKGKGGEPPKNRYYPRINAEILLAFRAAAAPQEESRVVKTKTIGLGGLMFEVDHPLPVGSVFHLDLVFGEERLKVGAKVIYAKKTAPDVFQIGFAFTDLTEDQRERLLNLFLEEYEKLPSDGP